MKKTNLQKPPVVGTAGGHDDPLLLEGLEPQREPELLAVFIHPMEKLQVGLPVEPQRRL